MELEIRERGEKPCWSDTTSPKMAGGQVTRLPN